MEHCDIPLTRGAWNSPVGTAAREYTLCYSGRRHPNANLCRRLEQLLHETVKCNAYGTCECRSPTYRTDGSQWRRHNHGCGTRATEKLMRYRARIGTVPAEGSGKYFMAISGVHTARRGAHICFQTIVRWERSYANGYDINTLRMISPTQHTVDRRNVFYAWGRVQRPQQSPLVTRQSSFYPRTWVAIPLQRHCSGSYRRERYLCGFCLLPDRPKVSTVAAWRCASSYKGEVVVSARWKMSAVAEHDISRKVDWAWGALWHGLLCRRFQLQWILSCADRRSKFTQSLPGVEKISWQDFKQLWLSMPACKGVFERMQNGAQYLPGNGWRPLRKLLVTRGAHVLGIS
jgi:hypothetical protein